MIENVNGRFILPLSREAEPVAHAQPAISLRQCVSVRNQVSREVAPLVQHAQHVERLAVNAVEQQEGDVIRPGPQRCQRNNQ